MALPAIAAGAMVAGSALQMTESVYPPAGVIVRAKAWESNPIRPPEPADLLTFYNKGLIPITTLIEDMKKQGFDENTTNLYQKVSQNYLNALDYITLERRGIIPHSETVKFLTLLGFTDSHINMLMRLTEYVPGPADIVRFAVRDVYSPNKVAEYRLLSDIPEKYLSAAKAQGMSDEFARYYWGAHWELPSMTMGFDMFQRRIIDKSMLEDLMAAQDIMPVWRDKLIQLSYNPLTRVDVRRMYGFGVLDRDGVYNSYLDTGYSPENAKLMTDFTLKYEDDETTGLTRQSIINAYKSKILDRKETIDYLEEIGYADTVISFYISVADSEIETDYAESVSKEIQNRYLAGMIEIEDVKNELNSLNLPSQFVNNIISKLQLEESKKRKVPSKGDLDKWLDKGIIDDKSYYNKMKKIGYIESDIILYLTEYRYDKEHVDVKYMSDAIYKKWFQTGIINVQNLTKILQGKKYSQSDIDNFITEAKNVKPKT